MQQEWREKLMPTLEQVDPVNPRLVEKQMFEEVTYSTDLIKAAKRAGLQNQIKPLVTNGT